MNYSAMMFSAAVGALWCALIQRWLHASVELTMLVYIAFLCGVFTKEWVKSRQNR